MKQPPGLSGLLSGFVKSFRLRHAMREARGARAVLDLGCGLCEIVPQVPDDTAYLGVERDRWMFDRAVALFPDRKFVRADIEDASWKPDGTYDVTLLVAVWEHLKDPAALLRRAHGWSAPGAKFVLTTPSPRAHAILDAGARLRLLSSHADEEHERLWSIDDVRAAAAAAGWRVVKSRRFLLGLNQLVVLQR